MSTVRKIFASKKLRKKLNWNNDGAAMVEYSFLIGFLTASIVFFAINVGSWMFDGWQDLIVILEKASPG